MMRLVYYDIIKSTSSYVVDIFLGKKRHNAAHLNSLPKMLFAFSLYKTMRYAKS